MDVEAYHIISEEVKIFRNYGFNPRTHSPLYIDTHVLTSHVDIEEQNLSCRKNGHRKVLSR